MWRLPVAPPSRDSTISAEPNPNEVITRHQHHGTSHLAQGVHDGAGDQSRSRRPPGVYRELGGRLPACRSARRSVRNTILDTTGCVEPRTPLCDARRSLPVPARRRRPGDSIRHHVPSQRHDLAETTISRQRLGASCDPAASRLPHLRQRHRPSCSNHFLFSFSFNLFVLYFVLLPP